MKHHVSFTRLSKDSIAEIESRFTAHKETLYEYADKLLWWNGKLNLISRHVSRETVLQHIKHSLFISISPFYKNAHEIVDAGTGGGLPGLPLAITDSSKSIVLNDVVKKKIIACKSMNTDLGLHNTVFADYPIQEFNPSETSSILVTKHAFKLNNLYAMVREKPYKGMVMLKGKNEVVQELSGISDKLEISVTDLENASKDGFFEGKAMVQIKRI